MENEAAIAAAEEQPHSISLANIKFDPLDLSSPSIPYLYLVSFHIWSYISLLEA